MMSNFYLRFYHDSPHTSAMVCPILAQEGRNGRFADIGVSTQKNKTINSFYHLISLLVLAIITVSCHSATKKTEPASASSETGVAKFDFSEEIHNFGSLKAGEVVSFTYVFKNSGTKTLTIEKVDTDCGCTEVNIPNKKIAPGQEGQIEVVYNSAGEVGKQLKTITVFSNAEKPELQLFFQADVANDLIKIYS